MKNRLKILGAAIAKHRIRLAWVVWTIGLLLLAWGALFRAFEVLDKPTSSNAREKGVTIKIFTEAQLVSAVSTDRVELGSDGMLKTVPDQGFCES